MGARLAWWWSHFTVCMRQNVTSSALSLSSVGYVSVLPSEGVTAPVSTPYVAALRRRGRTRAAWRDVRVRSKQNTYDCLLLNRYTVCVFPFGGGSGADVGVGLGGGGDVRGHSSSIVQVGDGRVRALLPTSQEPSGTGRLLHRVSGPVPGKALWPV